MIDRIALVRRNIDRGISVASACRMAAISPASYYRWKRALHLSEDRSESTLRTRRAILAAAEVLFLRDGFAASLSDVATLAGISRQTIYNLFGDRAHLFSELIDQISRAGLQTSGTPQLESDLAAWLRAWARPQMQMSVDPKAMALLRITMGEFADHPELAALGYAGRAAPDASLSGAIARRLAEEMRSGVLRQMDPLIAAESFIGACTAHIRHRAMIGEPPPTAEELEMRLNIAVALFLDGLGYSPPTNLQSEEPNQQTKR